MENKLSAWLWKAFLWFLSFVAVVGFVIGAIVVTFVFFKRYAPLFLILGLSITALWKLSRIEEPREDNTTPHK